MLKKLSLEEKIGQLIIPRLDFNDPEFDIEFYEYLIGKFHIGNFIVFGGTVPRAVETFNRLQKLSKHPILFSADLERGLGQQIEGATAFPYFMGLAEAAKKDPSIIYETAKVTALESHAIGIRQNFSPVLDIHNNPENPIINIRSFGETPETVTACGLAYVKGLQEHGIIATAKHFPGHGDTLTDSHMDLPVILHPLDRLEKIELAPFKEILRQEIDSVMMGHIVVPALDASGLPASLSKKIMTDLLRKKWNYNGLIVNDALMMGAIAKNFSQDEAVVKSFLAGADQVLIPVSVGKAFEFLLSAVKGRHISERRLEESVERVFELKRKLGLFENRLVHADRAREIVGCGDHLGFARRVTRLCFVIKKGNWLKIQNEKTAVWLIKTDEKSFSVLEERVKNRFTIFSSSPEERISVPDFSAFQTVIIITDLKPMAMKGFHKFPEFLSQEINRIVGEKAHLLIACGSPYIIDALQDLKNGIATYSSDATAQEELAGLLMK